MSGSDDDGLEPPGWVNSGRPPADGVPSAPGKPARRPRASTSRGRRPAQPAAPVSTATIRPRSRPSAQAGGDFWGKRFDDGPPPGPEGPRRQRPARRAAERGDRRRRRTVLALAIVLLPVVLVLTTGGWFLYELNPPGTAGRRIGVDVKDHEGNAAIGDMLETKGVIGSSTAFQIYTKITRAGPFEAGHYSMRESTGVRDAVNVLKARPANAGGLQLTLPPGLTLDQVADRVGRLRGHTKAAFLAAAQSGAVRSKYEPPEVNSLEGLVYPDTYFVKKGETDEQILTELVSTFDQRADGAGLAAPNTSGLNPYQQIVVASLVEREAKLDEDRPLISAVIHNRLVLGEPLQIDATVCYAKGGCDKSPTTADLAIVSPYNTYQVIGLPPTPISSVSVKSLQAAANPASVPYLYYVLSDKNGKHAFATTPEEHQQNVEEARKKGLL